MIQIADKLEIIEVIRLIASGVNIHQIQHQCELKMLQDAAPVIASYVLKLPFGKPIPENVSSLLSHLYKHLLALFQGTTSQSFPIVPAEKKPSSFPSLPMFRAHQSTQLTR